MIGLTVVKKSKNTYSIVTTDKAPELRAQYDLEMHNEYYESMKEELAKQQQQYIDNPCLMQMQAAAKPYTDMAILGSTLL